MGGIISTDTFSTVSFSVDSESFTIDSFVLISVTDGHDAVRTLHNNSTLINNGFIFANPTGAPSPDREAVEFAGTGFLFTNNAGGVVKTDSHSASAVGVYFAGTINNAGAIIATDNDAVSLAAGTTTLTNTGIINGDHAGIEITGGNDIINNSGLIEGTFAFHLHGTAGTTTTLSNSTGGQLQGSTDAVFSDQGRISIANHGTITGDIALNDVGGQITNAGGTISGDVTFAHGANLFDGRGGMILGEVHGGDGADTLIGGKGGDSLFGGLGADAFSFKIIKEIGKGAAHDVIGDFSSADHDVIDLTALDAKSGKGNQAFHYIGSQHFHHKAGELNFSNHVLSGDTNGDGKADFQITLTNVASLTGGIDIHL